MFTALRKMAVARVFAFSGLTPLLATLGAHFLLHEFLSPTIFAGIIAISTGVALTQVFRPSEERQV
jgi:drug/metabolite transporter (DMT)-like permease